MFCPPGDGVQALRRLKDTTWQAKIHGLGAQDFVMKEMILE